MRRSSAQPKNTSTILDKPLSFRDALKSKLSPAEQARAIYSFDVLGDLALIEIPDVLQRKRTLIGNILLACNPRVKKVYEKVGIHSGKFRVEKIKWLAGQKNPETIYAEWGCTFHVDVGKVFFNPRLSTERQRVTSFVKKGQTVAVFFGGVGPYAIQMAKHAQPRKVYSIEWNPSAEKYVQENIIRNHVSSMVESIHGDIEKILPRRECDHVVMPAPENAIDFLPTAIHWLSKKGGLIHCYTFVSNHSPELEAREKIMRVLGKKIPFKLLFVRKVSDFSSSKWQVCVGIKVSFNKRGKK